MSVSVLKKSPAEAFAEKSVPPMLVTMLSEIAELDPEYISPCIADAGTDRGLNMIRLGGLLSRAEAENVWKSDPSFTCETFLDWCREAHGIESGRVHAYRRAYQVAAESGLDPAELSKLDTYKLCRLLPRVIKPLSEGTAEKNTEWLEKAKTMSRAELEAAIQAHVSGNGEGKKPRKQPKPLKLKPDQAAVLDAAITVLQKKNPELKGKHKPHLVESIMQDWMSYQQGEPNPVTLESAMSKAGPVAVAEAFEKLWPGVATITITKELAD